MKVKNKKINTEYDLFFDLPVMENILERFDMPEQQETINEYKHIYLIDKRGKQTEEY